VIVRICSPPLGRTARSQFLLGSEFSSRPRRDGFAPDFVLFFSLTRRCADRCTFRGSPTSGCFLWFCLSVEPNTVEPPSLSVCSFLLFVLKSSFLSCWMARLAVFQYKFVLRLRCPAVFLAFLLLAVGRFG